MFLDMFYLGLHVLNPAAEQVDSLSVAGRVELGQGGAGAGGVESGATLPHLLPGQGRQAGHLAPQRADLLMVELISQSLQLLGVHCPG